MDNILRQSTAATIVMGVMVDSTDGNTPETGLTIAQADIRLSKNGGAYAQSNNVAGATHMETGKYSVPLDTTDTATLGKLRIDIHKTGALAVWREFTVVTANAYDALVLGTDVLQADVTKLAGVTQSLTDLKDFADDGYDPATNQVEGTKLVDTTTTNTDMVGTTGAYTGTPPTVGEIRTEMDNNSTKMAPSQTLADYKADVSALSLEATVAALNNITVADIIAGIADGTYDLQEMMRIMFSACCLKVSGGGTTTISTRDSGDAKNRIVATVDENGNRTAVTLDGS